MTTKKLTSKQIGALGERLAIAHLRELGYDLVRFGMPDGWNHDLPHTGIWVGASRGDLKRMMEGRHQADTQWRDPVLPAWADLASDDTANLARACQKLCRLCPMIMTDAGRAPCSKPEAIFDRAHLESIYPQGMGTLYHEGEPVPMHGGMFAGDCSRRFDEILGLDLDGVIVPRGGFMRDNAVIDRYVEVMMGQGNKLPHGGLDILAAEKKDKAAAERMKDENRAVMAEAEGLLKGAPGRYDFIGHRDGEITAIEVKVNSSRMTYLQELRFQLLNRSGHKTMLLHIKGSKEALARYRDEGSVDDIEIELIDNPVVTAEPPERYPFSADFMGNHNSHYFSLSDIAAYQR